MSWKLPELEKHLLVGSTLVEGSTLSEREAGQVLAGRTVAGHTVFEIRELLNYRFAVEWLMHELESTASLSEDLILNFQRLLFEGLGEAKGSYKVFANYTYLADGRKHAFVKPARVKAAIHKWLDEFNAKEYPNPQTGAAELYYAFENIHPFEDGNGRIGRVLIAYWLHWKHLLGFRFYLKDKQAHLEALQAANAGDWAKLIVFFKKRLREEK